MKKIVITAIAACVIGCGNEAEAKTPVSEEIESTANIIIVPNTETISYHLYRKAWRKANNKPAPNWAPDSPDYTPDFVATTSTHKDPEDDKEIVEIELSDLSFNEAFNIELRAKGQGHVFWWRGKEYTTNLLNVIRKPASDFKHTDPYIERIVPIVKETVPTEVTLPKEEEPTTEGK